MVAHLGFVGRVERILVGVIRVIGWKLASAIVHNAAHSIVDIMHPGVLGAEVMAKFVGNRHHKLDC